MTIHEKIIEDWKEALKSRDIKKDSLNMILSELKNRAIAEKILAQGGRVLSDQMAIETLLKLAKQRKETIEIYQQAKRPDLVDKELRDLKAIEEYLPKPLSLEELKNLVKEAIKTVNASSIKDIGKVMPVAIKMAQGKADGKEIQKIAQEYLS